MVRKLSNLHGAIAQLGERIVRNDEVVGSIPTSSTINSITCAASLKFTFNFAQSPIAMACRHLPRLES